MKKTNRFLAALLSVLMVVTMLAPLTAMQAIAATDVTITDLMTDNVKNPVGIDNTTPHFSWKMQSSTTGQKQTAYEIIVSTDKTFQDSSAVVWNPGKVSSDPVSYTHLDVYKRQRHWLCAAAAGRSVCGLHPRGAARQNEGGGKRAGHARLPNW